MIKIYTIGFTGKSAENFFDLLQNNEVQRIIDTRINNTSQLAGFAKASDLKYFAQKIGKIDYQHQVDLAPTKDLLADYRNEKLTWNEYEIEYLNLLDRSARNEKLVRIVLL